MKREIKFRAWNGIVKRMQYFTLPDIEKQIGNIQWHVLTVMQYTGLKDANGVEIYEGDIVKWGHKREFSREMPYRIAIVEFNPDIQFKCINISHTFRLGSFSYARSIHLDLEVIGNIYENTELL